MRYNREAIINAGYTHIASLNEMPSCTQLNIIAMGYGVAIKDHRNTDPFLVRRVRTGSWEVFIKDSVRNKVLAEYVLSWELEIVMEQADWDAAHLTHRIYKKNGDRKARVPKWILEREEMYSLASLGCQYLLERKEQGMDTGNLTEEDVASLESVNEYIVDCRERPSGHKEFISLSKRYI